MRGAIAGDSRQGPSETESLRDHDALSELISAIAQATAGESIIVCQNTLY
jgi:hypothetical protein